MSKIPTAEEFIKLYDVGNTGTIQSALVEFAKLHVKSALEVTANKWMDDWDKPSFNKDSILNAYPLNLIL